ncbi:MAG: DNA polymerase III subunit alpha [Patescibacteria group bacterium]|nr:DNA polymerase III subunit alpha [Patescibacteria group bacterium]
MSEPINDAGRGTSDVGRSPFVHLHVHSMYSLSDAMGDAGDLVKNAKDKGYDAIALTDHSALYGVIEFYEAAQKAGIKPIIGVEANIAPNLLTDKRPRIDDWTYHLTILAETDEGYQNLLKLVSISYLEGFYYKARMDKNILRQYHKGLIALSGCAKGQIPKACQEHDLSKAEAILKEYQDIFGVDNFFLELVHHPESPTQIEINRNIIELAKKTGAPLVGTKDVHYFDEDDVEAQDALQCIHAGKLLSDNNRFTIRTTDHSLVKPEVMINAFKEVPEAIENTRKIADRCNVTIELGKNLLPKFEVPEGETEMTYLRKITDTGMLERYGAEPSAEAKERLEFELSVIERMGFPGYFLIVHDYVNWAKNNDVIVGPGRGSAAGSIVAYALKITNLDPLKYGLLFERFLNPDRISMPDVDMDFDDVKRKDVIEYVTKKYGADRVAGIITFGTMAARAAVRDVGRVLGWTFQEVDRVAKVIPPPVQGKNIPIHISRKENPELKALDENDPKVTQLLDLASRLEGTARHASQHACGIVIAPASLVGYAPLQKAQGGDVDQVIQYSLHPCEAVGLLKMDFLGLSNLTIIRECLEIIEAVHGDKVDLDNIPLDNEQTFELLGRAETTGVFQLESDGMKRYIRDLKPSSIDDIIAMVALYRPGPMQFIESFINRKHGKEKIVYAHPLTENALKSTYGIPVYQEQVMQVSKDMAGFTGGQADTLRKAMGKKIAKLMAEMREKFISGSIKNGVEQSVAEAVFTQFEEFAAYGFNKSHAACYAMIAYQTAYLKAHYPECFMAALLNSDCMNLDRITIEVEECRRMGINVLPPDVNESFAGFSVIKSSITYKPDGNREETRGTIRFGLLAIKGLGNDVVEYIIKDRKDNSQFKDLADFISRIKGKYINKKSLESLIRSGATDCYGDRGQLYYNVENMLDYHRQMEREANSGQVNLFATEPQSQAIGLNLKPAPPVTPQEKLKWEKELLGLYVSEHPFKYMAGKLSSVISPIADLPKLKQEKKARIGGVVTAVKKIYTKKNEPMLFCKLEDGITDCEVVVFPRVYQDTVDCWVEDKTVIASGRPAEDGGKWKLLAEAAYEVTNENIDDIALAGKGGQWTADTQESINQDDVPRTTDQTNQADQPDDAPRTQQDVPGRAEDALEKPVTIYVSATLPESTVRKLRDIFDANPGVQPVEFMVDDVGGKRRVKASARIHLTPDVISQVESFLGPRTVTF